MHAPHSPRRLINKTPQGFQFGDCSDSMSSRSRRERDRARSHPDAKAEADTADLATPMASDSPQSSQKEKGKEGSKAAASHAHNGKDDADGAGNEGEKPHDEVCEFIRNSLDPKLAPLRVEYEAVLQGTSKSCHRSPRRSAWIRLNHRRDSIRPALTHAFSHVLRCIRHTHGVLGGLSQARDGQEPTHRGGGAAARLPDPLHTRAVRGREKGGRRSLRGACRRRWQLGLFFCGLPAAPSVHSAPRSDTA